jgi:hypothetical protein
MQAACTSCKPSVQHHIGFVAYVSRKTVTTGLHVGRYSNSLRAGRSAARTSLRAWDLLITNPVRIDPLTHPASTTTGRPNWALSRKYSGRFAVLKTNRHIVPRLGMSVATPLLPHYVLIGILRGDLYLGGLNFLVSTAFQFFPSHVPHVISIFVSKGIGNNYKNTKSPWCRWKSSTNPILLHNSI